MVGFRCFCLSTVFFTTILTNAVTKQSIIYAKSGDDVKLSFTCYRPIGYYSYTPLESRDIFTYLPYIYTTTMRISIIADGFDRPSEIFKMEFYYRRYPAVLFEFDREKAMKNRLDSIEYESTTGLHFVLKNASQNDAGKYMCSSPGYRLQMEHILVIVEAPVNASIAVEEPLIGGKDVELRCLATSLTRPHRFRKPMKFRWFEFTEGLNETEEQWTEIHGGHKKEFFERTETDDEDIETGGSGWEETNVTKGRYTESLRQVLEISPLSRKDHGRRITCSAMEDLNLWSDNSPELVLSVNWKPIHSDLTLVPNVTHSTLDVGDSIDVICMASCRPECNIIWERVLAGNETVTLTENSTLSLQNVSHLSHGVYRCRGSNLYGSAHVQWKLSVTHKHWLSEKSHIIAVVAIVTVTLAFGFVATSLLVLRYRKRRSFTVWSHWRLSSVSESVPSLSDPKETAVSSCSENYINCES